MTAEAKAGLRTDALARRAAVDPATRAAFAQRLAALGPDLARRLRPRAASAFASFGDEVDTAPICAALRAAGVPVALPVVVARGAPLVFRIWAPGDPVRRGPFGIVEPAEGLPEVAPDLVFAPLAAFDRAGHRIGYGGGYYDRTLAQLRAAGRITAVGVAFAAQEVAAIPAAPHDQKLDMIVTEHETIEFT
jgi:5-formyltetrahydrofolate cyclo-ligase